MKKPTALTELIQELQDERNSSDVEACAESYAQVYLDAKSLSTNDGIKLTAEDCLVLLASAETVERLVEVLESKTASIMLYSLELPDRTLEALERNFVAVDEE
jgi:hypothetical protein